MSTTIENVTPIEFIETLVEPTNEVESTPFELENPSNDELVLPPVEGNGVDAEL